MSRYKFSSPDQPALIRLPLKLYEFAASLSLAVILIFSSAAILGYATFVEAAYGTPVVQFYIYQSWWFTFVVLLLAINIFCAAAIRYPWKRHQTGFVITHIGLLTLLLGSYIGCTKKIDAQVSVFEGQMGKWAIDNHVDLEVSVQRTDAAPSTAERSERIHVPFHPGLFNWDDWSQQFALSQEGDENISSQNYVQWKMFRAFNGYLFSLAGQNRPHDVLYDKNGIKVEILDYYSDSEPVNAPYVKLFVSMPKEMKMAADGTQKAKAVSWMPVELSLLSLSGQPEYPYGWSQRERAGGGYFTLQLAASDAQQASFLKCLPEGKLGEKGQVALYCGGEITRFQIDDKLGKGKFKLAGQNDVEAEVIEYWPTATLNEVGTKLVWQEDKRESRPANPAVKIMLHKAGGKAQEMLLLALEPQSSIVDHKDQIYGEYWYDHNGLTTEERGKLGISARIDFLAGHDQKLYYRYWNREEVVFAKECPTDGSPEKAVDGFKMPIGQLKLYVKQFVTTEKPQVIPIKQPFVKDRLIGQRVPAAKLRMTVDDNSQEFWLFSHLATPDDPPRNKPNSAKTVEILDGKNRVVALTMPIKAIDIGFRVRLSKFERKLDPGTDQPSHYASWVDFIDHDADRAIHTVARAGATPQAYIWPKLQRPTSIAMDAKSGYLYWIDASASEIRRVKWSDVVRYAETAKVESVVTEGLHRPTALLVDGDAERLYWADAAVGGRETSGVIRSAGIDGDGLKTLAQVARAPETMVLGPDGKYLYFTSRAQNAIGRLETKSGDVEEGWCVGPVHPLGLAISAKQEKLYWTEAGHNTIRAVKLSDPSATSLVLTRKEKAEPHTLAVESGSDRLWIMESLPNPPETAGGLPTSKPIQWRLVSVAAEDGNGEIIEADTTIDEPNSLAFNAEHHPLWTQTATTRTDVWITMNAPVDCRDPQSGRSYRLFQERFAGPFKPGMRITNKLAYEDLVPPDSPKSELYESILTVNYDPGRGIRNVGCLFLCLGIGTMFYMRAYFFKPHGRVASRMVTAEVVEKPPVNKPTSRAPART